MRKLVYTLGFAFTFATASYADSYQSSFGFSVDVPSGWFVLNQQQLQSNISALNPSDPRFIGMDAGIMQQFMDRVRNGQVEVYFHKGFGTSGFVNNVNILKQSAKAPANDFELKETCGQLPGEFSQYFGHPIAIYHCVLTRIGGKNTLLLEFDGALGGTRSIQYQIQSADDSVLVMTGTFTNGTLEQERATFAHIATSLKFK